MKRVVSLWLPSFATDRLQRRRHRKQQPLRQSPAPPSEPVAPKPAAPKPVAPKPVAPKPVAIVIPAQNGIRVAAVNRAARAAGLAPGLTLAEARALLPALSVVEADGAADRRALAALADWCSRYTPWTAVDPYPHPGVLGGGAGLWLDITGASHLFGGEAALLRDVVNRLASFGITAQAAVADTAGAAWAAARFADDGSPRVIPPGDKDGAIDGAIGAFLAPLPVAALRLPPALVESLCQVGLRRIGDLAVVPREALARRFGDGLLRRLDQAWGRCDEPLSPRRPVPAFAARLAFAEPIGHRDDIERAVRHLIRDLCARLDAAHQGLRRAELTVYRTDGSIGRAAIGTARPVRDPRHLWRLFREPLESVEAGFGIELATLAAVVVAPLAPMQMRLQGDGDRRGRESLERLIDRLANRLGTGRVVRLAPRASHLPERAQQPVPAGDNDAAPAGPAAADGEHNSHQPRPLVLLPSPEPIRVIAPVPDGPPVLFRRGAVRHRVVAAEGPERIGPEWWCHDGGHGPEQLARIRDYYRIEDSAGQRFWIYREGLHRPDLPPRWYLHGLFP
ncbi:MAG: DNA polymerase Y family protein [Rhodospirillales bacterium]|nr:MAG: DNA polymerase Y family protein [Rhodospirillales bacterium]